MRGSLNKKELDCLVEIQEFGIPMSPETTVILNGKRGYKGLLDRGYLLPVSYELSGKGFDAVTDQIGES